MDEQTFIPEGNAQDLEVVDVYLKPIRDGSDGILVIRLKDAMNRFATFSGFLSEKGWPWTEKALVACGWIPERNGYDLDALCEKRPILGVRVDALIQHDKEEWTDKQSGQPRERMVCRAAFINPAGGFRMKAEDQKTFTQRIRGQLARWSASGAAGVAPGASQQPQQPRPATANKGKDIPF